MNRTAGFGIALLLVGGALVVAAVVGAPVTVSIVLFVPVFSSPSWEFGLGAVLIVLGIAATSLGSVGPPAPAELPGRAAGREPGAGGFVLIGPVPIFFGSFARLPSWVRWTVALLGAAALLGLAFVYVLAR